MTDRKEPPFFNDDRVGAFHYKLPLCDTMELFIETLTGTCFELRVLPFEAVISVKAKIQRLEGNTSSIMVDYYSLRIVRTVNSIKTSAIVMLGCTNKTGVTDGPWLKMNVVHGGRVPDTHCCS